ncbi:homoserine dehydrogenase [Pendulispora rubella]|uniref:Homoserine dehydrogenase n=1 Tax=Pendulispora rubella TaxID=2741070 RepID=A0ABZ2LHH2_9BACT
MKTVRLGLLGCGTVGGGVVRLIRENASVLATRVGAPLEIAKVLVRDPNKERVPGLERDRITTDAAAVLGDPSIDVVVEVLGGVDPAKGYVEQAIDTGRSVVTANKMLLAVHGPELVERAEKAGVDLAFEASVGGGIPVIRTLREALTSDAVTRLCGIVNGTSNYILTRMRQDGLPFVTALKEAQDKGYAEADPGLDVDGHDAAHKLVVLAMLAFGARVPHETVYTEGIRDIEPIDHEFAARFGYTVKHLAIGQMRETNGKKSVELRVHPALLPTHTTLANVNGVLNAILLEGRALGPCLLSGRGAGDLPTAVSVVADVVDVAGARLSGAGGRMTRSVRLAETHLAPIDDAECAYYLRFQVFDRPGVLAHIAGALAEENVSILEMVQRGGGDARGEPVQVVMMTHVAREGALRRALAAAAKGGDYIAKPTHVLRVAPVG